MTNCAVVAAVLPVTVSLEKRFVGEWRSVTKNNTDYGAFRIEPSRETPGLYQVVLASTGCPATCRAPSIGAALSYARAMSRFDWSGVAVLRGRITKKGMAVLRRKPAWWANASRIHHKYHAEWKKARAL